MKLRIGSRASRLAVIQSRIVMEALKQAYPDVELELVAMTTTGDRILDRTLDQVGGKGLFVKELDRALLAGEVDVTVHSLKDMPMETPSQLPIAACSRREDARDALVLPQGKACFSGTGVIGCASARRAVQLKAIYPQAEVRPIRGNLQTRLGKLDGGAYDALVLACAGLRRLGLEERICRVFSPKEILPAAGQGILGIQCRRGETERLLAPLDDRSAHLCARAERAFVRALGGGCSDPTAAYCEERDGEITLTGMMVRGGEPVFASCSGPAEEAEDLGCALARSIQEGGEK